MNAGHRARRSENLQIIHCLPAQQGRNQTSQSQDMIQMAVSDQNAVEALETDPRFKDLALRTLAAVDQKAVLVM